MQLTDMTRQALSALMADLHEPAYRAGQVYAWLLTGVRPEGMTNLPKALREKLAALPFGGAEIERKLVSPRDGTAKYLFRLDDENLVEGVLMKALNMPS